MNELLPSQYAEVIHRLALGLEAIDAERQNRIHHSFRIAFDDAERGQWRAPIERHDSCLHVLRAAPGFHSPVDLRLFDSDQAFYHPRCDRRRFVPRRLRVPLLAESLWDARPVAHRTRRPVLFPGAAYDLMETSTGLRGRVVRNGEPLRWARVAATTPGGALISRAHGDDRGEFLLLLGPAAAPDADLPRPLSIQVTVFGPVVDPVPGPGQADDPLWDLPLETLSAPDELDAVSAGLVLPAGYTALVTRSVDFELGRIRSAIGDFVI